MLRVVWFGDGCKIVSKDGEKRVGLPVIETIFALFDEDPRGLPDVCKAVKLPRQAVRMIYSDLLRMMSEARPYPSGVVSPELIGRGAYGGGVGPNNDYLLPREGSQEAQRIDAERASVLFRAK